MILRDKHEVESMLKEAFWKEPFLVGTHIVRDVFSGQLLAYAVQRSIRPNADYGLTIEPQAGPKSLALASADLDTTIKLFEEEDGYLRREYEKWRLERNSEAWADVKSAEAKQAARDIVRNYEFGAFWAIHLLEGSTSESDTKLLLEMCSNPFKALAALRVLAARHFESPNTAL